MFCFTVTDECYKKTFGDTKTAVFLISAFVVILALMAFSIYLVAKPVVCEEDLRPVDLEKRMLKRYQNPRRCRESSILVYPQVAAIIERDNKAHVCSGAIISQNWMVTAAHCLGLCKEKTCYNFNVRAGSSYTNRGGNIYEIVQFELHPGFHSATLENDIGLIKVEEFHLSDNLKTAKLSSVPVKLGQHLQLLGWTPYSKVDIVYRDNTLRMINITIEPNLLCRYRMKGSYTKFTITNYMLCGLYPTRGGGCYTDPGAPFLDKDVLQGIAMFGQVCYSCEYHMSILTDIYYFRNFIKNFTIV